MFARSEPDPVCLNLTPFVWSYCGIAVVLTRRCCAARHREPVWPFTITDQVKDEDFFTESANSLQSGLPAEISLRFGQCTAGQSRGRLLGDRFGRDRAHRSAGARQALNQHAGLTIGCLIAGTAGPGVGTAEVGRNLLGAQQVSPTQPVMPATETASAEASVATRIMP